VAAGAQAVAVAFTPSGDLLVQLREPAGLVLPSGNVVKLSDVSVADTGHDIFHSNSGAGLACASCHPEGGEDGRAWVFADSGPRRSQSLREGVLGTEPFHWGGEEVDFPTLTHDAFVGRMAGPDLTSDQQAALTRWVTPSRLLADSPSADPASAARGAELFSSPAGGCIACHSGPKLTDNLTLDVGTGGRFQVPPLGGVAWRAPFLHDGRAPTLRDTLAGQPRHGNAFNLTDGQIDDLVAYMETL
jgi:cytochrome c peroxidase